MQNYLPACKIVSTHGVRGEMKALPLCDGAQSIKPEEYDALCRDVRTIREVAMR